MDTLGLFFLDPVVTRAVGASLSIVLLAGAWQKLRDPVVFAGAVENYRLLPAPLVPLVARGLPLLELAAGLLLLFPETCFLGGAAALAGVVGAGLLGGSRAVGETMIVVMAAGLAANLTINPLEAVTTVTAQIVTLLVGDQEFDSPKTLAAFALGLLLFVVTLCLNVVALRVVRKYREKYD